MKLIPLTQGKFSQVDDEDYEYINKYKWYYSKPGYASRAFRSNGKIIHIKMHREIIAAPNGLMVDHKDGNGLNNQKNNIRICTSSENQKNKKASGASKYLGVGIHISKSKAYRKKTNDIKEYISIGWVAHIKVKDKYIHLGRFQDEVEAAKSYNNAAIKYHGEFARLNKFDAN